MRKASSRRLLTLLAASAALAVTSGGVSAQARQQAHIEEPTQARQAGEPVQARGTQDRLGVFTIATGLDNPRGLDVAPNGTLYVAEAGSGGAGPCFPGPEGDDVCWGETGAITKIWEDRQSRVLTGLPSIAAPDGSAAIGPSDVAFGSGKGVGSLRFTVGLGADPAVRGTLPASGQQLQGWLSGATPSGRNLSQVADIAGFEAANDPDGNGPDSNPNSLLAVRNGHVVADAGGNSLLSVSPEGAVSTWAVFPNRMVDAPPSLGLEPGARIPLQSVPTSVARGPDGAFYVGELTGFPFPPGAARIHRVLPGQPPEVFATGFTNIIDIGFTPYGELYVLEIAHDGLSAGGPGAL
ncbi:MAG: ScyD/ScyE family protein, partial [Micromonosporaceae bacterium]